MTLAAVRKSLEALKARLRTPVAPFTVEQRDVHPFEDIHIVQGRTPSVEVVYVPASLFILPMPFDEALWIASHPHLPEVPEPELKYGLYSAPPPPDQG
jgi:hypothetical protein